MEKQVIALEHADLHNIDDVKPLSDTDADCLREVAAVLKRYDSEKRFGISLLHTHFPILEGEVLVEFCDQDKRTLTIKPIELSQMDGNRLMETCWRFDLNIANQRCYRYCVGIGDKDTHQTRHDDL